MARRRTTITQWQFGLGAVRPEAVERDDTDLVGRSCKEAQNTVTLTTGSLEIRPGTVYVGETDSSLGVEVDIGSGRVYDLHIVPNGVILYDSTGAVEVSFVATPWTSVSGKWGIPVFSDVKFWVATDPDSSTILIGAREFPIHALQRDSAGAWVFGVMNFATSLAGAVLQPYWNYNPGITIQPSALSGTITVTASSGIWTTSHSGLRIRYLGREIVLGSLVSSTIINATVTEELPPTWNLTVASASGYQIGEAVTHSLLGGQGIITGISGSVITVLATAFWDGFSATDKLVGPNANQAISAKAAGTPAASYLWDMQLMSQINGYAGHAARHMGRTYLCDFPNAPQAFAVSVAGYIDDFTMGVNDGDGFVETLGANDGGDLKFIISAEDLLFFTTRGLYYQRTRYGTPVTPSTIGPLRFSRMGVADVLPVAVDDGAIYVDSVGEQVYAVVLTGGVYAQWKSQNLTKFHSHLINTPIFLGATSAGSEKPEQYIYVVNSDGTAVVCEWDRDAPSIGWRPWATDGTYRAIYQAFGKTYSVVDRTIASVAKTFRERFEDGVYMDCAASLSVSPTFPAGQAGTAFFGGVTATAAHLNGHTATVYFEGWDLGDHAINSAGAPLDSFGALIIYPAYTGTLQIGLPFVMRVVPWSRRASDVDSKGRKRNIRRWTGFQITVQDTGLFTFEGREFGAYRIGEDLTAPPPFRSEEAKFIIGGRDFFRDRPILKSRPGPFRMLKCLYKVTI